MADRTLLNEVDIITVAGSDNDIKDKYTRALVAEEEEMNVASRDYQANEFFIQNDRYLYRALTDIQAGTQFVIGNNCRRYSISKALRDLYAQSPEVLARAVSNVETTAVASKTYDKGQFIIWTDGGLYEVTADTSLGTAWRVGTNISEADNVTEVIKDLSDKTYNTVLDPAETALVDTDYFPFYDVSANKKKKTLFSNIKEKLDKVLLPKAHAIADNTYGTASATLYGHVKLSDAYTTNAGNANSGIAASPYAVYQAYTNRAPVSHASSGTGYGVGNATNYGHVKLSDVYKSNIGAAANSIGASQNAVFNLYKYLTPTEGYFPIISCTEGTWFMVGFRFLVKPTSVYITKFIALGYEGGIYEASVACTGDEHGDVVYFDINHCTPSLTEEQIRSLKTHTGIAYLHISY